MDVPLSLSRWLKRLRRDLDITQDMLAERVGCSVETIRAFEAGRRRPSREMAARLADVLGVVPGERAGFLHSARVGLALPPGGTAVDERSAGDLTVRSAAARNSRPSIAQAGGARSTKPPGLVRQPTTFVGRAAELAEIRRLLGGPDCRLLSIVGPGGIGKTRLALEAAAQLGEQFADGLAVVGLAQVTAAEQVAGAISDALGLTLAAGLPVAEALLDALRDRDALLVLDNLEHVLDAVPLLAVLLHEAPDLRLLVTSRERLHLQREWIIELSGLALPGVSNGTTLESVDAIRLFVERASQAAGAFTLTPANSGAVTNICRLLGGLPLGIELAAAWVRALTPAEIAAELERGLDFLAQNTRDADERHSSLRVVIDASWARLTGDEQRVLLRLAVFRGGCTREAAVEVAAATLPLLTALIDKSMVGRDTTHATTRYTLHELVRQYAEERLAADPNQLRNAVACHTAYYAALLQRSIDGRTGALTVEARAGLNREVDNLRAAWLGAATNADAVALMRMSRGMWVLHEANGWLTGGAAVFGLAAGALRDAPVAVPGVQGYMLVQQGAFVSRSGDFESGMLLLEQGMALVQANETAGAINDLLLHLAILSVQRGEISTAERLLAGVAAAAATAGDHFVMLWAELFLGWVARFQGAAADAEAYVQRCLQACRTHRFARGEAFALAFLGDQARIQGRHEAAAVWLTAAMRVVDATDDALARCLVQGIQGWLAVDDGALDQAYDLLAQSATTARQLGESWTLGYALCLLGQVALKRNARREAQHYFSEVLTIVRAGTAVLMGDLVYAIAQPYAQAGDYETAYALLCTLDHGAVDADIRRRGEQLRATLEQAIAPERQADARARHTALLPWLETLVAHAAW